MLRQFAQAFQVVNRQEIVHEWLRRQQTSSLRLVAARADQRVEPDQAVRGLLQALHRLRQQARLALIPTVGDQQHDRAAPQHALGRAAIEAAETRADPRAARPVVDTQSDLAQRVVHTAALQGFGDSRQARTEGEAFDAVLDPALR